MFLLKLLPFLIQFLIFLIVMTQLIIPLLTRRAVFPLFRSKRSKSLKEISKLHSTLDEAVLQDEIADLKKQLEAHNPPPVTKDEQTPSVDKSTKPS